MDDHSKLKTALGISSRSLVHHWDKAGAPGQIPGYATHVSATSRAAQYMKSNAPQALNALEVHAWLRRLVAFRPAPGGR